MSASMRTIPDLGFGEARRDDRQQKNFVHLGGRISIERRFDFAVPTV